MTTLNSPGDSTSWWLLDFQVVTLEHFLSVFSFSATAASSGDGVPANTLLGTYLKKSSGIFIPKQIIHSKKLPSRGGVEKDGREKAKEYCRRAQPKCPQSLRTSASSSGSVPSSLIQVNPS